MDTQQFLAEVLEAHGGRDRWQSVKVIEASLSSGGFAFATHCQPSALRGLQVSIEPHEQRVAFRHFGGPGWSGVWSPSYVALHDAEARMVCERHAPRDQFRRFVKNVVWDKLDILYFAGYALWNYLSFPFLLAGPGVAVSLTEARDARSGPQLAASFPPSIATHSPRQVFHFDQRRHLVRHDYTADVIGGWATAANCILASEEVGGLRFYTRRKVYPRMGPRQTVLPLPLLVWIEIDDIAVSFAAPHGRDTA